MKYLVDPNGKFMTIVQNVEASSLLSKGWIQPTAVVMDKFRANQLKAENDEVETVFYI